jgi:hypothetical protein
LISSFRFFAFKLSRIRFELYMMNSYLDYILK